MSMSLKEAMGLKEAKFKSSPVQKGDVAVWNEAAIDWSGPGINPTRDKSRRTETLVRVAKIRETSRGTRVTVKTIPAAGGGMYGRPTKYSALPEDLRSATDRDLKKHGVYRNERGHIKSLEPYED